MDNPKELLTAFWHQCARLQMDHDLFHALYMSGQRRIELFQQAAPMFFGDVHRLLRDSFFIQACRITDPAGSGSRTNLTTNYLLQEICWPSDIKKKLEAVNACLVQFRACIEPARSKRLAHADLRAELDEVALGKFSDGADRQFLKDLEAFLTIAHEHLGETPISLSGISHDVHALVRALVTSQIYDRCTNVRQKNERLQSSIAKRLWVRARDIRSPPSDPCAGGGDQAQRADTLDRGM
jgi:AbiU2